MARFGSSNDEVKCSFCGKSRQKVAKVIAGPGVYICDECIDLCNDIIENDLSVQVGTEVYRTADPELATARESLRLRLDRRPTVAELAAELAVDEQSLLQRLRRMPDGVRSAS